MSAMILCLDAGNTRLKCGLFDGKRWRFDLAVDPMELNPLPIEDEHPLRAHLEQVAFHHHNVARYAAPELEF